VPRGDTMQNRKCRNKGGTNRFYMPPSRNTVFAPSKLSEKELSDRWEKAFGHGEKLNGGWECTCNYREETKAGRTFLVKDRCKIHGRGWKKIMKLTGLPKKHSSRQTQKAKEYIIYGNSNIREVMNRN